MLHRCNTTPFVMIKKRKEEWPCGGTGCWPFFSFSSNGERSPQRELAEELEVSGRTDLRDLNALSALGSPWWPTGKKTGDGACSTNTGKTLLTLTAEEIASLFLPFPETLLRDLGIDRPFSDRPAKTVLPTSPPRGTPGPKTVGPHPHRSGTLEGKNRKTRMDDSRAAGGLGGEKTEDRL